MLPLVIFFLYCSMQGGHTTHVSIITVIIGQNPMYGIYSTGPAYDIAFEEMKRKYAYMVPSLSFHRIYKPRPVNATGCVDTGDLMPEVAGEIVEILNRQKGFAMIFSPGCSLEQITLGDFARELDVPLLTSTSADNALTNRKRYPTLIVFSPVGQGLTSRALREFLLKFNWRIITVYCDALTLLPSIATMFTIACRGFKSVLTQVAGEFEYDYQDFDSRYAVDYEKMLLRAKAQSRVILIATNGDVMRQIMLVAKRLNMTGNDYVFLFQDPIEVPQGRQLYWELNDSSDATAYEAFQSIIMIQLPTPDWSPLGQFVIDVAGQVRSKYNYTYNVDELRNDVSLAAYEAVAVSFRILNETWPFLDTMGGRRFTSYYANHTFDMGFRSVVIGANGIRKRDTWFKKLDPVTKEFEMAWYYTWDNNTISALSPLADDWRGLNGPPPDKPKCGFLNDRCPVAKSDAYAIALGTALGLVMVAGIISTWMYLRHVHNKVTYSSWWHLDSVFFYVLNVADRKPWGSTNSDKITDIPVHLTDPEHSATVAAMYQEERVWLQIARTANTVTLPQLMANRKLLRTLAEVKTLQYDHVSRFMGILLFEKELALVWEYGRGSMRHLLDENRIIMDEQMKLSFIYELLKGLAYIHTSRLRFHGSLSSLTVLLDSRYSIRLAGVASRRLDTALANVMVEKFNGEVTKLWMAPEQLEPNTKFPDGSRTADIFSLAIVMCEIWTGAGPRNYNSTVVKPSVSDLPFNTASGDYPPELRALIDSCFAVDPHKRPDIGQVRMRLKKFDRGSSVMDGILKSLDKYSADLEDKIAVRTGDLLTEMAKVDSLLKEMIPGIFVGKLRNKEIVAAEEFAAVTIFFSDLVGFDQFCQVSTSPAVVELLNDVYRVFDRIVQRYDVYKVETIKDSYMIASGLPLRNGDRHVVEIADTAIDIMHQNESLFMTQRRTEMSIRIGMHTGPCAAGIVGLRMPRYCLFGDTINTASRMESHGEASRIHVSSSSGPLLAGVPRYNLEPRGPITIKGKGEMLTYWLTGEPSPDVKMALRTSVSKEPVAKKLSVKLSSS
ncbi:atrial natriuretic peptide receptor 1-like [Paramacrobiotus metropolitanus]|uniref:atrial natriuretic peptide receptor 1-like n=1 Tax=Paramacrobiotus metropolitanus TaxID=2943436 RepID=UPI0024461834|nr:atrial natriuretic peptide receptor 1-like [Paramacrobiotus metropolitanus]